jgi:hypothetical protein
MTFNFYVDGVILASQPTPGGSAASSWPLDTREWSNGTHIVAVSVTDTNSASIADPTGNTMALEWSQQVTFSNIGASAFGQLVMNAHELYLQTGQTFQLSGSVVDGDGTSTIYPMTYYSQNPSACTVSSTGLVTAVGNGYREQGNGIIRAMATTRTGSDLSLIGMDSGAIYSPTMNFSYTDAVFTANNFIKVTGGTGWNPGNYEIGSVNWYGFNSAGVSTAVTTGTPGTNGVYELGPSRSIYCLVSSTNTLPHWGNDGTLLTTYNPAKSYYWSSIFQGLAPGVQGDPGYFNFHSASGYNTLEFGLAYADSDQITGMESDFQSQQTTYVTNTVASVAAFPKLNHALVIGDSTNRSTDALYASTRGTCSTYMIPCFTYENESWRVPGTSMIPLGNIMSDEVNSGWDHAPLAGPITFHSSPTVQSGLTSIVSDGMGTCTVNWLDWSTNGAKQFVISGATTSGFNSAPGTAFVQTQLFTPSGQIDFTKFTIPCTVAAGTYNQSTDPTLTIEPFAAFWVNGNTDYIHYDAWAILRNQQEAATNPIPMTASNAGGTSPISISNWYGNGIQSIPPATQVGDFSGFYFTPASFTYLSNHSNAHAYLDQIAGTLRLNYGWYPPSKPMETITGIVSTRYGIQGYDVALTGGSNGVITFASDPGLPNIIPGITRLTISGSSNSAWNADFYVQKILSPTQWQIVQKFPNFAATGPEPGYSGGGTITYQDSTSETFENIINQGNACYSLTGIGGSVCGQQLFYTHTGLPNADWGAPNRPKKRGETFTLSGLTAGTGCDATCVSAIESGTFVYLAENLFYTTNLVTFNPPQIIFRQLPSGSTTGGTATIIPDNLYEKGRSVSSPTDIDPATVFLQYPLTAQERSAGNRAYISWVNPDTNFISANAGSSATGGFGATATTKIPVFSESATDSGQIGGNANPQFPAGGYATDLWHAGSMGSKFSEGLTKYLFQPQLNSPDCGYWVECAARSGSAGKILLALNTSNGPQSPALTLTPYLTAGQQIIRYIACYNKITTSTIAAGTTSDTPSLGSGCAAWYKFPVLFAGEYQPPVLRARLGDVTGATKIIVRYNYDPYWLDTGAASVDCGGSGSCTVPVDLNIGTVYYRIIYTDSTGKVLSMSDIQQIS